MNPNPGRSVALAAALLAFGPACRFDSIAVDRPTGSDGAVRDAGAGLDASPTVSDAAPADSGAGASDATLPMTVCGNRAIEAGEDCEGIDLAGADCTSLGGIGGVLACDSTCRFDASGCVGVPTVPVLRRPMNNAYRGSVHVAGSLTPQFSWEPSTTLDGAAIEYELEYSTDPLFGALVTAVTTIAPEHEPPADLSVPTTAPVGARYYWRVRACVAALCSDWSATWWVNVGRSDRDFNGDGWADAVVASHEAIGGGEVYIYAGGPGPGLDVGVDALLVGTGFGSQFGWAVSTAADVNADGYADLLVGAPNDGTAGLTAGAVHVFFGGPGVALETVPDVVLPGMAGEQLGSAVAAAGDVDADGYDDIIIGARRSGGGWSLEGAAYLHRGGPVGPDLSPAATFTGVTAGDDLGFSVASAGDVNGDGRADVLVGVPGFAAPGPIVGAAHLYLGDAGGLDPVPAATFIGLAGELLGVSVAGAGDVNDDGFADWAIGAPGAAGDEGRADVYLGGLEPLDLVPDTSLPGDVSEAFGTPLAAAGDVNGDDYADVLVAAVGANFIGGAFVGVDVGLVRVYLGGPGAALDASPDAELPGIAHRDNFGWSTVSAGDVDGDLFADVLVGAPMAGATNGEGQVQLFLGGAGAVFDPVADVTLDGAVGVRIGYAVALLR